MPPRRAKVGSGAAATKSASAQTRKRVTKTTTKSASPFDLVKAAVGSYEVTCEEISAQWGNGDNDDALALDISMYKGGDGLIASFDFNILEGTMLLTESQ
ncbi:hypothetical protein K469DRAFT_719520 [Zopfia rhizophila CBS 207.26]|uniref:Uncharacterized protein n=1 Tax=Zopfia rhizophila CBS 207.26 TaxID=1314779 RepID=A0A6A6DFL4_9PEZI|nr:hypothetical protein K469DRAFT_719520 [Zopfia rhizophila CBS 207.26]